METGTKPADQPRLLEQVSSPWGVLPWDQVEAPGRFRRVWDVAGASPTPALQVWQPTSIYGCCSLLQPVLTTLCAKCMEKEIPINADKDGDGKVTVQTAKGSWGDAKPWQAVGHPLGLCQQRARRDRGAHPSPALSHSPTASWAGAEAGPKLFVVSIKRQAKDAEALLAWLCAGDTEACEMIATEMSAAASQPELGAQQSSLHCKGWHRRGLYGKKWGLHPNTLLSEGMSGLALRAGSSLSWG